MEPLIIRSDREFIRLLSLVLASSGLAGLLLLMISMLYPGWPRITLLPVSGAWEGPPNLSGLNLPLAALILGLGLQLHTRFGWFTSLVLTWILAVFFGVMTWFMWHRCQLIWAHPDTNPATPWMSLAVESLVTDLVLTLICLTGVIYLILPTTRRLYGFRTGYENFPYPDA
ncbi:MAG: hypothetical protein SF053_00145 [Bacteroidia bacterium]|nr:hypothetical protein [Bacteroidia bacterium]